MKLFNSGDDLAPFLFTVLKSDEAPHEYTVVTNNGESFVLSPDGQGGFTVSQDHFHIAVAAPSISSGRVKKTRWTGLPVGVREIALAAINARWQAFLDSGIDNPTYPPGRDEVQPFTGGATIGGFGYGIYREGGKFFVHTAGERASDLGPFTEWRTVLLETLPSRSDLKELQAPRE